VSAARPAGAATAWLLAAALALLGTTGLFWIKGAGHREREQREEALRSAESRNDVSTIERLRVELGWLDQLRKAEDPVLEPASDVEEAR